MGSRLYLLQLSSAAPGAEARGRQRSNEPRSRHPVPLGRDPIRIFWIPGTDIGAGYMETDKWTAFKETQEQASFLGWSVAAAATTSLSSLCVSGGREGSRAARGLSHSQRGCTKAAGWLSASPGGRLASPRRAEETPFLRRSPRTPELPSHSPRVPPAPGAVAAAEAPRGRDVRSRCERERRQRARRGRPDGAPPPRLGRGGPVGPGLRHGDPEEARGVLVRQEPREGKEPQSSPTIGRRETTDGQSPPSPPPRLIAVPSCGDWHQDGRRIHGHKKCGSKRQLGEKSPFHCSF